MGGLRPRSDADLRLRILYGGKLPIEVTMTTDVGGVDAGTVGCHRVLYAD
jgi:hypothetical protein